MRSRDVPDGRTIKDLLATAGFDPAVAWGLTTPMLVVQMSSRSGPDETPLAAGLSRWATRRSLLKGDDSSYLNLQNMVIPLLKSSRNDSRSITLGRDSACDIRILDARVSRSHCAFTPTDQGWQIVDRKSTNGTTVNDVAVGAEPVGLKTTDVIGLGPIRIALIEHEWIKDFLRMASEVREGMFISEIENPTTRVDPHDAATHEEIDRLDDEMAP